LSIFSLVYVYLRETWKIMKRFKMTEIKTTSTKIEGSQGRGARGERGGGC
jgi:hypothetical protein